MPEIDESTLLINNIFTQLSTILGTEITDAQKTKILEASTKTYKSVNGKALQFICR